MPLTRYQIRNEYSLADPELYRAADKDDPEALLEGVAMAGLVGVLRQLGDLAEFAAEIFHDLHEEVMATATRGHGLTIRVQQLEAEFPSVEKAILSQTSHTSFIKNAGSDWHPNLEMNQNLITRGDLPRFIMDSYEECRGPPRLFLLDKFDIAGAGACLKRYSDPSFFKAEFNMSKSTKSEDKKEKRTRKTKKKVLRTRNGENAEIQTSHSKLHDLFLEESGQNEDKIVHKHRVKLKRRLSNRSLVDSTTRTSYMERILDGYSPNGTVVSGNFSHSLQAKNDHSSGELVPEIHEICTRGPANILVQKDWAEVPSPTKEKNVRERSLDKLDDEFIKEGILEELPKSTHDIELEDTLSTICDAEDQKELVVNGERKIEVSADGYKSDDVTSEIENYMDALNTMESEIETDTESRSRNGIGFMVEKKWMNSGINEGHREIQVQFSDTHSIGSSLASDDGTHSLIKERLSLSHSYSNVNLPDSLLSDGDAEAKVCPSTEIFPAETVDLPVEKNSHDVFDSGSRISMGAVPNGTWNEVPDISSYASEYEETTANSNVPESTSAPSNVSEACSSDVQLVGPHSSAISSDVHKSVAEVSLSNVAERDENRSSNISDLPSLERDDMLSVGSHGEQAVEMLKGGKSDASYDAAAQLSGSLDLADEKLDANYDTSEEFLRGCDAEDGFAENLVEDKHDLPDSVAQSVDHCLAEQESDVCSVVRSVPEHIQNYPIQSDCNDTRSYGVVAEIGNGLRNGKAVECSAAVLDSPEEKQFMGTADGVPYLQLDLAEVGTDNAEIENLDEKPGDNKLDSVIQDKSALDKDHLNYEEAERNNDLSLDFSNRSAVSYSTETELAADNPSELCNLAAGAIREVVDDKDTLLNHILTDISSGECKQFKENDFSKLNLTERIAEQTEAENQSAVFSSEDNLVLSYQESDRLSGSPLIDNMHNELLAEGREKHSQDGDGFHLLSSALDGKQETKLEQSPSVGTENCVSLSTHLHSEPAVLGMSSDQNVGSHQVEGSLESSHEEHEWKEYPDRLDVFSSAPLKSFPMDPISVQSDVLPSRPVFGVFPSDPDDQGAKVLDAPPLPPLPPLQWRMGKFQQNSVFSRGMMPQQSLNPFSAAPIVTANAIAQQGFPTSGGENLHYSNPFLPSLAPHNEKTQNVSQVSQTETMLPSMNLISSLAQDLEHEKSQHGYQVLEPTAAHHQNSFLAQGNVRAHHVSSEIGDKMLQASSSNIRNSSLVSEVELEEATSPRSPMCQEEEKVGQAYHISGGDMGQHTNSSAPATLGNENSRLVSIGSEGGYAFQSDVSTDSSALETAKPNGSLKAWLARPRDPLIEAVASHNKSNLRKVTERVRPEISPRVEERDSLLEQIRTKSFNLRPATATRPSIQGPKTNLKVVAILEKANAIRQALAGSDDEDDDEDKWSDS